MPRTRLRLALLILTVGLAAPASPAASDPTSFSRLIESLSEGPGFFPSDNLVSNETSYLHVLGGLRARGVHGGAYLGVGPEQGFAYIAEIEPAVAFVVDIRRDNMLLHLLLKAMFERASNRLEYLCLLYGRTCPEQPAAWNGRPLEELLAWIEASPFDSAGHAAAHARLVRRVEGFGVPLSDTDRATIDRFHLEFAGTGLELRYTNLGRSFRPWFPTIRDIYEATDLDGRPGSYLATEERWLRLKRMQREDRIVPVVGDLAGPKALRAIGDHLRREGLAVSAFYLSNVESYLFRGGTFEAFADNVRSLPADSTSVLIRSWFGRGPMLPNAAIGHLSTQQLHAFHRFLTYVDSREAGPDYWSLVMNAADENPSFPVSR